MTIEISNTSELLDTWASSGPQSTPDSNKVETGWEIGERPPAEFMNWLQNTFGQKINRALRDGVTEWNAVTSYRVGDAATRNGSIWLALSANAGSAPTASNNAWTRMLARVDFADSQTAATGTSGTTVMTPQRSTDHFNARTTTLTRTILGRTTEAQIRGDLSVLQSGTGNGQARTNAQNDGRFLQQDDFSESWSTSFESATSEYGRTLIAVSNAGGGRSALELGTMATRATGTAGSQHQTNTQNRGEFAQLDRGNWGSDGLGGLGYGGRAAVSGSASDENALADTQFFGIASSSASNFNSGGVAINITLEGLGTRGQLHIAPDGTVETRARDNSGNWSAVRTQWNNDNLSDPATLSESETFTGRKSFINNTARQLIIGRTDSSNVRLSFENSNGERGQLVFSNAGTFAVQDSSNSSFMTVTQSGDLDVSSINGGALPSGAYALGVPCVAFMPAGQGVSTYSFGIGDTLAGSTLRRLDNTSGSPLSGSYEVLGWMPSGGKPNNSSANTLLVKRIS